MLGASRLEATTSESDAEHFVIEKDDQGLNVPGSGSPTTCQCSGEAWMTNKYQMNANGPTGDILQNKRGERIVAPDASHYFGKTYDGQSAKLIKQVDGSIECSEAAFGGSLGLPSGTPTRCWCNKLNEIQSHFHESSPLATSPSYVTLTAAEVQERYHYNTDRGGDKSKCAFQMMVKCRELKAASVFLCPDARRPWRCPVNLDGSFECVEEATQCPTSVTAQLPSCGVGERGAGYEFDCPSTFEGSLPGSGIPRQFEVFYPGFISGRQLAMLGTSRVDIDDGVSPGIENPIPFGYHTPGLKLLGAAPEASACMFAGTMTQVDAYSSFMQLPKWCAPTCCQLSLLKARKADGHPTPFYAVIRTCSDGLAEVVDRGLGARGQAPGGGPPRMLGAHLNGMLVSRDPPDTSLLILESGWVQKEGMYQHAGLTSTELAGEDTAWVCTLDGVVTKDLDLAWTAGSTVQIGQVQSGHRCATPAWETESPVVIAVKSDDSSEGEMGEYHLVPPPTLRWDTSGTLSLKLPAGVAVPANRKVTLSFTGARVLHVPLPPAPPAQASARLGESTCEQHSCCDIQTAWESCELGEALGPGGEDSDDEDSIPGLPGFARLPKAGHSVSQCYHQARLDAESNDWFADQSQCRSQSSSEFDSCLEAGAGSTTDGALSSATLRWVRGGPDAITAAKLCVLRGHAVFAPQRDYQEGGSAEPGLVVPLPMSVRSHTGHMHELRVQSIFLKCLTHTGTALLPNEGHDVCCIHSGCRALSRHYHLGATRSAADRHERSLGRCITGES